MILPFNKLFFGKAVLNDSENSLETLVEEVFKFSEKHL